MVEERLFPSADQEHGAVANDEPGHPADRWFAHGATVTCVLRGDNAIVSARSTRSFRWLLFLGAAVSVAIGVWGVIWTGMLETVLGLRTDIVTPAFNGLARLYGGVMLVIGVGYALAAAQPHRNRGLLVPLFLVPFVTGVMVIAGMAREEITGGRGSIFAAYNLVFCLFYFRLYPRLAAGEADASSRGVSTEGSSST